MQEINPRLQGRQINRQACIGNRPLQYASPGGIAEFHPKRFLHPQARVDGQETGGRVGIHVEHWRNNGFRRGSIWQHTGREQQRRIGPSGAVGFEAPLVVLIGRQSDEADTDDAHRAEGKPGGRSLAADLQGVVGGAAYGVPN